MKEKKDSLKDFIFFDNASTTRVDDRVFSEMRPYFTEYYGNPSSLHDYGQIVSEKMEESRKKVADLINADPDEVYFTSSGTEANNFAISGISRANKNKGNHIITSEIEHYSVLNYLKEMQRDGWESTLVPVDKFGMVDPKAVKKAITKKTVLVTIMHANNEIGSIQDIKEIAAVAKGSEIYFHSDGIATAGIIPVDMNELGVDAFSFSSQQMYGPKGIAALYVKKGTRIRPLIIGGTQENGRRGGTENVPGIIGFGKACELAKEEIETNYKEISTLRDDLINGIQGKIEKTVLNGHPTKRLPGNVHISYEYVEGESIILMLNINGIAAASGSSCASHALKTSQVLNSIKLPPELANGSVLFSLGKFNTKKEIEKVIDVLPPIINRLREMSPLTKR